MRKVDSPSVPHLPDSCSAHATVSVAYIQGQCVEYSLADTTGGYEQHIGAVFNESACVGGGERT